VQSPPQDILQVPSASAALASAMDSGKFTLTAEFVAVKDQKFPRNLRSGLPLRRRKDRPK